MSSGRHAAGLAGGDTLAEVLETLAAYRLMIRAASGGCIGNGMRKARWAICWARISRWRRKDNLYRCLDKLLAHKEALFSFLQERWKSLFQALRSAAL